MLHIHQSDKVGKEYWNKLWDSQPLPQVWNIESKRLRHYVERKFYSYIASVLKAHGKTGANVRLVEVGCARSQALPVFARRLGISVAGIDYSPNGCEQTRTMLKREDVSGEVYCADIFDIPNNLKGKFDVVISFGLIEHFSDTSEVVLALSNLLKPDGIIITIIPNMRGVTGLAQKLLNRAIYDIHVPLTPIQVRAAHEAAGLCVLESKYFLPSNFGVLNLGEINRKSLVWWVKKIIHAILVRASMATWLIERTFGKLPATQALSPYVICVAVKPENVE